jgi:hypothetical protein
MIHLEKFLGDVYENYYQYYAKKFMEIDPDLEKRFTEEVMRTENLYKVQRGKRLSQKQILNQDCFKSLNEADWDIKSPHFVHAYGLIFIFIQRIVKKYERECSFTLGQDTHNYQQLNKGGSNYENKK